MLIKIENNAPVGFPVLEDNFRQLHPSEVFPLVLTNAIVEPFGYAMYDFTQQPDVHWDEKLVDGVPTKDQYGIWRQTWEVQTPSQVELSDLITLRKNYLLMLADSEVDTIYGRAVGNRVTEYQLAEAEAQQYKDAGYTGTVPESVAVWATAKNWTATQAADDILLQAAQWRNAQKVIRSQRLQAKERIRSATTAAGLDAEAATWAQFVATIRAQLGIA